MKISNKLPHFDESTLIIISNPTGAAFYLAKEDEVNRIADFKVEKPQFSDREDFGRYSTGVVYETGTKYDKKKLLIIREFKQQFTEVLKYISKKFNIKRLFLFTAKSLINFSKNIVSKFWKNNKISHWKGDYTKEHIFNILKKIGESENSNFQIKASIG